LLEQDLSPSPCRYILHSRQADPHAHRPYQKPKLIYDSILETVGNTPLVRLNRIPQSEGVQAEILVKCEFFNPGGSIKDRIGLRMLQDAEDSGRITPGVTTIIEPTSGNTGIGLALACAVKGYRTIVTLPDKMSQEKVDALESLGCEVIRTPTLAPFDGPESHLGLALKLSQEIPNAVMLDQYSNPSNPLAHYDQTAEELLEQTGGKIDYLVVVTGTGGHITGLSRKLKERIPELKVVGIDIEGSVMALPHSLNTKVGGYAVEGIGQVFTPRCILRDTVDEWIKVGNAESFHIARRLIKEEGIFSGGSAGTAVCGAIKFARNLPAGTRVVTVLPDSIRNYLSRFINDSWMVDGGYMEPKADALAGRGYTIGALDLLPSATASLTTTVLDALELIAAKSQTFLPVVQDGKIIGVVSADTLNRKLMKKEAKADTPLSKLLSNDFKVYQPSAEVQKVFGTLQVKGHAFVQYEDHFAIVTPKDMAKFIATHEDQ